MEYDYYVQIIPALIEDFWYGDLLIVIDESLGIRITSVGFVEKVTPLWT